MDNFKWSHELIEELIVRFQMHENLYNAAHPNYISRVKRSISLRAILAELKKFNRSLSVENIKLKLTTLRTQYVREYRKVQYSKESGAGPDKIYKPKLWCYDQLNFLGKHCYARKATPKSYNKQTEDTFERSISPPPSPNTSATDDNEFESNVKQTPIIVQQTQRSLPYERKCDDSIENILQLIGKRLSSSRTDDHLDYAAKNWIAILRSVPKDQQIYAVRAISDVMCEAQLGNLNRYTRLNLCDYNQIPYEIPPQKSSTENRNQQSFSTFSIKQLPSTSGSNDLTTVHVQSEH